MLITYYFLFFIFNYSQNNNIIIITIIIVIWILYLNCDKSSWNLNFGIQNHKICDRIVIKHSGILYPVLRYTLNYNNNHHHHHQPPTTNHHHIFVVLVILKKIRKYDWSKKCILDTNDGCGCCDWWVGLTESRSCLRIEVIISVGLITIFDWIIELITPG